MISDRSNTMRRPDPVAARRGRQAAGAERSTGTATGGSPRIAAAILALAVAACGDSATGPPEARVASVEVTSPVDTIMAVGRSAQLSAVARDDRGATVSGISFAWGSSNEEVATVSSTGVVQAVGPGTTDITATIEHVTGGLRVRVAGADLDAIAALLADPYAAALVVALGETSRTRVQAALADCASARSAGHVIALNECLAIIAAEADMATGATDRVLAAVLGVFARRAQRLLNL
jgi:hypothetical protein